MEWSVFYRTAFLHAPPSFLSLQFNTNYYLYFCAEGLFAHQARLRDAIVGVGLAVAGLPAAAATILSPGSTAALTPIPITDEGDPGWRRYPLSDIQQITTSTSSLARHKIIVHTRQGHSQTYGILLRSDFPTYQAILQKLYGPLVHPTKKIF